MDSQYFSRIINTFSKFLDNNTVKISKLKTIEDVLKLPIYSYKFLDKNAAKVLKELLDINDIESASQLDREYPFDTLKGIDSTTDPIKAAELQEKLEEKIEELVEKYPDIEKNLKKAITVSSIIHSLREDQENLKGDSQKVVVVGLDNAGKTAILNKFGGQLGINDLTNLKPTKGVDRRYIKTETSDLDLFIWDMGGQEEYRSKYLKNPESYFLQTDLLIYVIDVQDSERYAESFEYFEEILEILNLLEENPFVIVYIHKHDPDIKGDSEILLNIELLKDNLNLLLTQYGFDYEAYLTSIYSLITNEPQFSRYIKDVMRSTESLTNPTLKKVEGLGKTLEETMNAVIRLSESISRQLNNLDGRLKAIEAGAYQIAQSGTPISIQNPSPSNSRMQVLDELKELFQKKKKLNF
ncbi:MAG: ADP-ribosylation factor-like protein [Promethearchaeota archaeon]